MSVFAAVDLGASSGRVIRGSVTNHGVDVEEVHRFVNEPVRVRGTLHWDVLGLWSGILTGLRLAGSETRLLGIGVDSWAVDYALLDDDGNLLGLPTHYRDGRTVGVPELVDDAITPWDLYAVTGVQRLPFNTVYQFAAARTTWAMRHAATAVMIPDLFGFWLTGERSAELTNASTTGLLDVHERRWSNDVAMRLGIRGDLLPDPAEPGTPVGRLLHDVADETGVGAVPVWHVGSHDTASAVLGVPARDDDFAFISSGTWSVVGVELAAPVTTAAAQEANFSNELGVDGTIRFVRNVMGLWLLQQSVASWRANGPVNLGALLEAAANLPDRHSVIDPDRPEFLPPGDMPARIQDECRRTGQPIPKTPAEVTRCIVDSLAVGYQRAIEKAAELTGRRISIVHIVGGGAQNVLLCQLTADACHVPVIAGPAEAAAHGNVLVQARAAGVVKGDRTDLRRLIPAETCEKYFPRVG